LLRRRGTLYYGLWQQGRSAGRVAPQTGGAAGAHHEVSVDSNAGQGKKQNPLKQLIGENKVAISDLLDYIGH
jgi:hypothetical protein